MNDVEVQSICDYLEECLFEPSINWSPEQFAERSYSRWAVSEILDRVRGNPEVPIVSTVEVFMAEMTYFAHIFFGDNKGFSIDFEFWFQILV